MPPKKNDPPPSKTVLLGRPGSSLKIGIVGLPNVGKSSSFTILTTKSVPAENRPFCTVEPNTADVNIHDERFDELVSINKPASVVPAQLQIRDIAGLIRGASGGAGLGNAFLSHINDCDGLFHMVRCFDEMEVTHVEGDVDPVRDLEVIFDELVQKDLQVVNGMVDKLNTIVSRGLDKTKKSDLDIMTKVKEVLEQNQQIRCHPWTNKEIELLNTVQLLTAKPAIFLCNMSKKDYIRQRSKHLAKVKEWVDNKTGELIIPFSAELEAELAHMTPEEAEEFCKTNNTKSQITRIVQEGYKAINLIHFFTAGPDEVKCWTIQRGTKAPQAAGKIHTDMEKGFICAEIIHWPDYHELRSESVCRDNGKLHQKGREYQMEDGDIVLFKFNTSKGGKK